MSSTLTENDSAKPLGIIFVNSDHHLPDEGDSDSLVLKPAIGSLPDDYPTKKLSFTLFIGTNLKSSLGDDCLRRQVDLDPGADALTSGRPTVSL